MLRLMWVSVWGTCFFTRWFLLRQIMESIDLIPLDGNVAKITWCGKEFKDLHEALQQNLQMYLPLTMDALTGVHQKVKATVVADATRQMVCYIFWGSCLLTSNLAYRCWHLSGKIKIAHDLCWYSENLYVSGSVFVLTGCWDGTWNILNFIIFIFITIIIFGMTFLANIPLTLTKQS